MPDPAYRYRYAAETPEQRVQRHSAFSERDSDFLSPSVLQNLNVTEPVAEEMMDQARRFYDEDIAAARKENPNVVYGFNNWLEDMASSLSKVDPASDAGKALNPIGTAELYREMSRMHQRMQAKAEQQELTEKGKSIGPVGNLALGVMSGGFEFASTASGGLSDTMAAGLNELWSKKGAERYKAGKAYLNGLVDAAAPGARYGRGFGGLMGYIAPASRLAQAANASRIALVGGKTALTEGTWRYGLNKALATAMGAGGKGLGTRSLSSAGNFMFTEAGLVFLRGINEAAQEAMAGGDWKNRLAEVWQGGGGEPGMFMGTVQAGLSGATLPFMQKVGDRVARMFMGRAGSPRRLQMLGKSIKEMENWSQKLQAIFARGAGGSAEFSGLSLLPNLHDPQQPFGVAKDFMLLFGGDNDERSAAIERLLFHAANGFILKNMHGGKPVNEYSEKDRAAALSGGVDRLGVAEALTAAKRTSEEEANALFPDAEMREQIRSQNEGAAAQKVGNYIMRRFATELWGEEVAAQPSEQLMERFSPQQRRAIEIQINNALKIIGTGGRGLSVTFDPDPAGDPDAGRGVTPRVVPYGGSGKAAEVYGLTPDERRAVRAAIRETLAESSDVERDEIATNIIMQQGLIEGAARMGLSEPDRAGVMEKALGAIGAVASDDVRTREATGKVTPDEQIASRQNRLEDLYTIINDATRAGRIDVAQRAAQEAQKLETEVEQLQQADKAAQESKIPAGSAERPLAPGVDPQPVSDPNSSPLMWPEEWAKQARGQPVRILVGQTSDKQGVYRPGVILHTEGDLVVVQGSDGKFYGVTPENVLAGEARGEIFSKIKGVESDKDIVPRKPSESDEQAAARRMEHEQITGRGDTVEPIKEKKQPKKKVTAPLAGKEPPPPGQPEQTDLFPEPVQVDENKNVLLFPVKPRGAAKSGPAETSGGAAPKAPAAPARPAPGPLGFTVLPTTVTLGGTTTSGQSPRFGSGRKRATKDTPPTAPASPASTGEVAPTGGPPGQAHTDRLAAAKARIKSLISKPQSESTTESTSPTEPSGAPAARLVPSRRAAARESKAAKEAARAAGDPAAEAAARADQATRIIERQGKRIADERKAARTDPLTGVSNVRSLQEYRKSPRSKGKHWIVADVSGLGVANNNEGMQYGDKVLKDSAKRLLELGAEPGTTFRGDRADEFVVAGDPDKIAKIGTDLQGDRAVIAEKSGPAGILHNRLIVGTGATYEDATSALNRAKSAYAEEAKKQGHLSKERDPSKGWRPRGAGKAASEGALSTEAADRTGPTTTVKRVTGKPTHVTVTDLPEGHEIVGLVRSGVAAQVIVKAPDGKTLVITTGKPGLREPPPGWKQPATTKNAVALDANGNTLFSATPEVKGAIPSGERDAAPDQDSGRISTAEQAQGRLGSFRRRYIEHKGGVARIDDPVRRAYVTMGALAADPSKPASSVRAMEEGLMHELQSLGENPDAAKAARINAAIDAARKVREAKVFLEDLDRRLRIEQELRNRQSTEVNAARLISTQDAALGTAQRTSRDLAAQFRTQIDEDITRLRRGRKLSEITNEDEARDLRDLHALRKVADSLLEGSPQSTHHGRVDVSTQALPQLRLGDVVNVVAGGKDSPRVFTGLVVGSGEASAASLKRGVGSSGQRYREALAKSRRGEPLSPGERMLLRSTTQFPGKWVTFYTRDGRTIRVRQSDIVDVGPERVHDTDFGYDPETKKYGVEVTEQRFLSWFAPPERAARSRSIAGSGAEEQSINRTQNLLDGETEGYYVENKDGVRQISAIEAAELEARNTASHIRNGTARPDQYMYQAQAMLVAPEDRKEVKTRFSSKPEQIAGVGERLASMSPEARAALKPGDQLPEDTYEITTRYFSPDAERRQISDLTDAEKAEYNNWRLLAEQAEAASMRREAQQATYDESRRTLIPLHTDSDRGEWLVQHRTRGERGIIRQGQTLLAERTPEGTIHVRRISPVEAQEWLKRRGEGDKWEEWKQESKRDRQRLVADNNSMLAHARAQGQLKDYLHLLHKQFMEILDGRAEKFPQEGDLHKAVREWIREHPMPDKAENPHEYASWRREAEAFLFRPPTPERQIKVSRKTTDEEEGDLTAFEVSERAREQESAFMGRVRVEGGPMFRAAERVRQWREPNHGAQIRVEDDGSIVYVHGDDAKRDFYRAAHRTSGYHPGTLGIYGLGMMPGNVHRFTRGLVDASKMVLRGANAVLSGYHKGTKPVANLYSHTMDGLTQTVRSVTDSFLFDHIHDLLHHPDYGTGVVGETGKSFLRKMGVLFGDSDTAPTMRMYLNDFEGDVYKVAIDASNALRSLSHMPVEEQRKIIDAFEAGLPAPALAEYRRQITGYGDSLVEAGLFSKEHVDRYRDKYVHLGRWVWKQGDVEKKLKETEAELARLETDPKATASDKGRVRQHLSILKNVLAKITRSKSRVFIGDHPLDRVNREAIQGLYRRGFARERAHANTRDAEKHGLDMSVPWLLLMDGLLVEGRALAQHKMLERMFGDASIVKPQHEAPHDWIPIEGTRYSKDPVFAKHIGKSIEPQALALAEALNPDYNKARQVWDMVSGLVKSGLTVGNPANWHTQFLGNVLTLATRVPFFQIPSRLAQAFITLSGSGKDTERLEKYKRWNWTKHTNDATRELARMLDKDAGVELQGGAANENPYLGMGFFQTVAESLKALGHGHFRKSMRGGAKAIVDIFTSFDAAARIALHEYMTDTMKWSEHDARKLVDSYFDIEHLPKGWQFIRRYLEQFSSIKAVMGRNLGELVPNAPFALTNVSLGVHFWNMAVQMLTGMSDEEKEALYDASIPQHNAFHNWWGRATSPMIPDGRGSARVIDMNRFSPIDVGIRSVPGLRTATSGVENMLWEGQWAPSMEGKGLSSELADFASANLIYGPTMDYVFDRDRFNEGRGIRKQMQDPGAFGATGYLRYLIERGNAPQIFSAALPPGVREFTAATVPHAARTLRRAGEASDAGFLGTKPRYVTETDKEGKAVARKYDETDALIDSLGFRLERPDAYMRMREAIMRGAKGVTPGRSGGLERLRSAERGTEEGLEAKQLIEDQSGLMTLHRAIRLAAAINHYRSLDTESERKEIAADITLMVGSAQSLRDMVRSLALMEEYDLLRVVGTFFEQEEGGKMIPLNEQRTEKMNRGRFGSLREKIEGGDK